MFTPIGGYANQRAKVSENFAQFCHLALFYNLRLTISGMAKVGISEHKIVNLH
jgi:hypothetical protein